MRRSKNAYWIPTNRCVMQSLKSYAHELSECAPYIPMIIMDSGDKEIEAHNEQAVKFVNKKYNNIKIYHFNQEEQAKVISKILHHAGYEHLFKLFIHSGVNYGAVMNRIFLLSAAMNIDIIHRRDSDTHLQPNCPFPIEAEIQLMNCKGNYVAGSGYVGEWSLDLKPFIKQDAALFSVFFSALGVPEDLHDQAFNCLESGAKSYFKNDDFNKANTEGFYYPDAGNFVLKDLHKEFPCLPSDAISSDYFMFRMAYAFGKNVIFHERRVSHKYHDKRNSNYNSYIKSLIKYSDMRPIYWSLKDEIYDISDQINKTCNTSRNKYIADIIVNKSQDNINHRIKNIENIASEFISKVYPEAAKDILENSDRIIEDCNNDYQNHAHLLYAWHKIIASANKISFEL
ncbi:DUF6271 family protein [Microbulbifer sp. JMSA004]